MGFHFNSVFEYCRKRRMNVRCFLEVQLSGRELPLPSCAPSQLATYAGSHSRPSRRHPL